MSETSTKAEGYVHLSGNLYQIKSSLINYADGKEIAGIRFVNPRHTMVNGKSAPKGFGHAEMDQLRESIRTDGLQHPLIVFGKGNIGSQALVLLNGERRKRCIDKLKADNAMCVDPATSKLVPARELYDFIECRLYVNIDDKQAYKHAFSANDTAIDIGDGATVCLIKQWIDDGWTLDEVAAVTGKSTTWLRDTTTIIELDDVTFKAFANYEINRTIALDLAKIPSVRERRTRLEKSKELAAKRVEEIQRKAEEKLSAAEIKAENAADAVVDAKKTGDKGVLQQAKKRVVSIQKQIEHRQKKVVAARQRRVRVNSKDMEEANKVFDPDGNNKTLTLSRYRKCWKPVLDSIVETGGEKIDPWDAKLIRFVVEHGWMKGDPDIVKFLKEHLLEKNSHPNKYNSD